MDNHFLEEWENSQKQVVELKKQVESLQLQLRIANEKLEQYRNYSQKKYRDDYDYVPYEESHDRD